MINYGALSDNRTHYLAQLVGAEEYTDCISAEG